MSARHCRRCGNKIPRKYKASNGEYRKTPSSRRICYNCVPLKSPGNNQHAHRKERRRRKEILVKMLGGCCQHCGYKKSVVALSFHHKDPSKKCFDISHNGSLLRDWDELVAEAKKCDLLCLNCHAVCEEEINQAKPMQDLPHL